MVLKAPQKIFFLAKTQKKNLLKNFAPLNEPLNFLKFLFYFNPEVAHT